MNFDKIQIIHVEPTSLCNAECPQCARNILGNSLNPMINLQSLKLDFFKKNFNKDNISNIKKIYFCGTVGEPCATPDLLEICEYFKSIKPQITLGINTNGSLKTTEWFKKLGKLFNGLYDYVVFSIDGLDDTNHLYRKKTNFKKIIENASAYISTGASAHWDMLVFEHNKHQIDLCKSMAKKMGFTWFRSKQTDRWDIYPILDKLRPAEEYKSIDYNKTIPICERDNEQSIFIDYMGNFWPCSYMAEAYFSSIGKEKHLDIREYSSEQLLTEYSNRLSDNPFYVCKRNCGKNTGKRSQWKLEEQLK